MERNWYYVKNNNRQGPVKEKELIQLLKNKDLNLDTYLWTQGEENWKKAHQYDYLKLMINPEKMTTLPNPIDMNTLIWAQTSPDNQIIFIKALEGNIFGPYSLNMLEDLYKKKRLKDTDRVIIPGMDSWECLSIAYPKHFKTSVKTPASDLFDDVPISARIRHAGQSFWCLLRDLSLGGSQILVADLKLQKNDKISLEIMLPNKEHSVLKVPCRVQRKLNENLGYFLIFDNISKDVELFIQELNSF